MVTVAFLGLGQMGSAMASNIARAGHDVVVFNRSAEKAAAMLQNGVRVATTPREAAADAKVIISMVTGDDASRSVWSGEAGVLGGYLQPDALAVECSTVSYSWVMALRDATGRKGLRFLDCPVAGRPDVAAAGKLKVFAGGDPQDLDEARGVLSAFSKEIVHFGPAGSGLAFKLMYNAMGAVQLASLAETMAACAKIGVDLDKAACALCEGATGSGHVLRHAPAMASQTYDRPPQFTPSGRVKDLQYALSLSKKIGAQCLLGVAARDAFQKMADAGLAGANDNELFEFLRREKPPAIPE